MPFIVQICGRSRGELMPALGPVFPRKLASMIELQRTAVHDAAVRLDQRDGTTKHVSAKPHGARARHELQVDPRTWTNRPARVNPRATRTKIDELHLIAGSECHVDPVDHWRDESRVVSTFVQRLTHWRLPSRYCKTRTLPVIPRILTAYCRRRPCTYSVPAVAVPFGLTVRIRAVPIRTPSEPVFPLPSTSGTPASRPNCTPPTLSRSDSNAPSCGSMPELMSIERTPLPFSSAKEA